MAAAPPPPSAPAAGGGAAPPSGQAPAAGVAAPPVLLYSKHFTPLESNPELFTELAHKLGLSPALAFHDVLSLTEPSLLEMVPRPVHALVLVFPASDEYEARAEAEDKDLPGYDDMPPDRRDAVAWFAQTINNACGLYAVLHAVCNGGARAHVRPGSHLAAMLGWGADGAAEGGAASSMDRARLLEGDATLEGLYKDVAMQGDSAVPEDPEDEVDFHYVCFVRSAVDGRLYEMDGDRKGPLDRGPLEGEDVLSGRGLEVIQEFIASEDSGNVGFSLMALAPALEDDEFDS